MTTGPQHRSVTVSRSGPGRLTATNVRGGTVVIDTEDAATFTPSELLLVAIGACTAFDVDTLTSRRSPSEAFDVRVDAEKIRDEQGNRLIDIVVTFAVAFPEGAGGDAARAVLPEAVARSHDRLCTVGRTVETGTTITARVAGETLRTGSGSG